MQAGGSFVKLNKRDGSTVWRTLNDGGGMYGSAFSSPVFDEIAGKPQVIVQTREKLAGVDDADGKVLWEQKVPAFRGMNILTPTVFKNGIFTSTHRNASYFYQVSESGNGFNVEETWSDKAKGYMTGNNARSNKAIPVPKKAVKNHGFSTVTLIACIARMPSPGLRRANACITNVENVKKMPATRPVPRMDRVNVIW